MVKLASSFDTLDVLQAVLAAALLACNVNARRVQACFDKNSDPSWVFAMDAFKSTVLGKYILEAGSAVVCRSAQGNLADGKADTAMCYVRHEITLHAELVADNNTLCIHSFFTFKPQHCEQLLI